MANHPPFDTFSRSLPGMTKQSTATINLHGKVVYILYLPASREIPSTVTALTIFLVSSPNIVHDSINIY